MSNLLDMVWSEKYRPETLADCILPPNVRKTCEQYIEDNELPNLLLHSKTPGVGKTTLAHALVNDLDYDVLVINGSSDRNIDKLRGDITQYVSSYSLSGKRKVVLIDEADYLNPTSTQPALRGFIQEFSQNASFIFTCNYVNKLIPALRSRFNQTCFDFSAEDKKPMMMGMMERACWVLDQEDVKYDKKIVAYYIKTFYPDFRAVINELQKVSKLGPIVKVVNTSKGDEEKLISILKSRKFKDMRTWCAENHTYGIDWVANVIYNNIDIFEPQNQPTAIALVYDYCYKDKFAVSPEICMAACLSEIFLSC